mmetsp:Transcript_28801/g.43486  ORF Transcript_28801/g.43486 Transcript_28801/m.43486 type:complete len:109 (-) Transcript_28801:163-489(-)
MKLKEIQFTAPEAAQFLNSLSMKQSTSEKLWSPLLGDFDEEMKIGHATVEDIFYTIRALYTVQFLDEEIANSMVQYLVKRGYDSDDIKGLSSPEGGYRRAIQLITVIA